MLKELSTIDRRNHVNFTFLNIDTVLRLLQERKISSPASGDPTRLTEEMREMMMSRCQCQLTLTQSLPGEMEEVETRVVPTPQLFQQ